MAEKYVSDLKLGETYTDIHNGMEGICVGVVFYLNGCERAVLEMWQEKEKTLKQYEVDAGRLLKKGDEKPAKERGTGGRTTQRSR